LFAVSGAAVSFHWRNVAHHFDVDEEDAELGGVDPGDMDGEMRLVWFRWVQRRIREIR
jgi:hypothetical protein